MSASYTSTLASSNECRPFRIRTLKKVPLLRGASLPEKAITGRTLPPRVRLKPRVLTQSQRREKDKALLSPKIKSMNYKRK